MWGFGFLALLLCAAGGTGVDVHWGPRDPGIASPEPPRREVSVVLRGLFVILNGVGIDPNECETRIPSWGRYRFPYSTLEAVGKLSSRAFLPPYFILFYLCVNVSPDTTGHVQAIVYCTDELHTSDCGSGSGIRLTECGSRCSEQQQGQAAPARFLVR